LKPLNFNRTVFIDRSFGGHRLAGILRKVGFEIRVHKDFFKDDEDDDVWIPDVKARGWVILSSDKRIARDPLNVQAVLTSKAQVVMSSDNNTLPEFWGAAFITGRMKINDLLDRNPGPAYIKMSQHCASHVQLVKQELTHPRPVASVEPATYLEGPVIDTKGVQTDLPLEAADNESNK
jgi:hypothetical protein